MPFIAKTNSCVKGTFRTRGSDRKFSICLFKHCYLSELFRGIKGSELAYAKASLSQL